MYQPARRDMQKVQPPEPNINEAVSIVLEAANSKGELFLAQLVVALREALMAVGWLSIPYLPGFASGGPPSLITAC